MKIATIRKGRPQPADSSAEGVARLDRRTKNLTKRLKPGEVAIIDHVDIDRVSADALVACQVSAVVNASPSISGRYPNLGPAILVDAGIPLLDNVGKQVFNDLKEGTRVRIDADKLYVGDKEVASGFRYDDESITVAMAEAREGLSTQLEAFAANTMEYMKRERSLLLDGIGVPDVTTDFQGRHVLIVVRGYDYKEDLKHLRSYIREYRPVLVGVDGGADALLEMKLKPDMIIGDMDSVSDHVLKCGAEVVVHAYSDGRAPGLQRVQDLGVEAVTFPAAATSEDIAMLLADEKGADLIVAVGTHATLIEFLDKGRGGMASTFLTRLRVGGKLVDAKGVSRLYRSRISTGSLVAIVIAALIAIAVAIAISEAGQTYLQLLAERWQSFVFWLKDLFVIDFKYHVVSLISVFLAIALGIIIGTTALNGGIVSNLQSNVETLRAEKRDLEDRVTQLDQSLSQNSDFDAAVGPILVADVLTDQNFLVITVGDSVTAELRDPIIQMLQAAGASNTGAISLTDAYSNPDHADELLKFASSDIPAGVTLPESNNAGQVVGALLAAMLVEPAGEGSVGQPAAAITTVLSGLGSLGVLKLDSTDIQPAQNIVLVTSGEPSSDAGARNSTILALAAAFDKAGAAVVIAGDAGSIGPDGLITAAREDAAIASSISTIDNAHRASGQINVVWALRAEADQKTGAYGSAADAEPVAPVPN